MPNSILIQQKRLVAKNGTRVRRNQETLKSNPLPLLCQVRYVTASAASKGVFRPIVDTGADDAPPAGKQAQCQRTIVRIKQVKKFFQILPIHLMEETFQTNVNI